MYRFFIFYLPIIAVLFGADQLSKYWARTELASGNAWVLTSFLEFFLQFNPGAAFSILNEGYAWQYGFLVSTSIIVSAILCVWLFRIATERQSGVYGLILLLAGALGNLADRVIFGEVTDFIAVHWHSHYFPTFNLADSMISIGAIMMLLDTFFSGRQNA